MPLYPDSGTALDPFQSAAGGTGHVFSANTVAQDEVTLDAVEFKNGEVIQDYKWNEVLQGDPLTSLSVTTPGPATLVAFWCGDGNRYLVHTAIPDGGFTVIDSLPPLGRLGSGGGCRKRRGHGRNLPRTWNLGGDEGAQLWPVAVQIAVPRILQPRLSGDKLVISWPTSTEGYALEMTSDLSTTNSWTPVANAPAIVGFQNRISNFICQPSQYFRLRKQWKDQVCSNAQIRRICQSSD